MRGDLHEFLIVVSRFLAVPHLDGNLRKPVDNHSSDRRSVIRHEQNVPALLISSHILVDFSRLNQCVDVFYFMPIDRVRNLRSGFVIILCGKGLHLIQL